MVVLCRLVPVVLLVSLLRLPSPAGQTGAPPEAREWVKQTLRRYNLAGKASPEDVGSLAALKEKTLRPELAFKDRLAVFTEIDSILVRLLGANAPTQAELASVCMLP